MRCRWTIGPLRAVRRRAAARASPERGSARQTSARTATGLVPGAAPFGRGLDDPGAAQLAIALERHPRLLLLDEPTAFVSDATLADVLALARSWGTTVVLVEHREVDGVDRVVDLEARP